ncbi:MAG TPA: excinuclease ABC subunit A, partial [Pirellulaceae bacterium]
HNLDVVKTADWVIDLGPEGGAAGGRLIAEGTPEQVAGHAESHTGRVLSSILAPSWPGKVAEREAAGYATTRRQKIRIDSAAKPTDTQRYLEVEGATQHNLKHVSVKLPRDRMTVCCGPSGSGKSSLAMDTIYAEGQRRYVESLSAYARQFVGQMQKPHVERVEGLSPAIAIEQRNLGHTPRSTVGTTTEIYDYLRILFARLGTPHCPTCDLVVGTQTADEVIDKIMSEPPGTRAFLLAPLPVGLGENYDTLWADLRKQGYQRVRIDGQIHPLETIPDIDRRRQHRVEAVVDRIVIQPQSRGRIAESIEGALALGQGVVHLAFWDEAIPEAEWRVAVHSQHLACGKCGLSFEPLTPHNFSFNTPLGWCASCSGLGVQTGTDPAHLLAGFQLSLADGAMLLWPTLAHPVSRAMLESLGRRTGIPLDVPWETLSARHRRLLLWGTGEQWFDVLGGGGAAHPERVLFRFQFKGLYAAIEEAARLSPALRFRLSYMTGEMECTTCGGSRLRDDAGAVRFRGLTMDDVGRLPLGSLRKTIADWKLNSRDRKIAGELIREIRDRVQFLNDVGLEYLTLRRGTATLSGGEAQRIRLASQLGSGLCGVLYVLDEPTIGLHPRDSARLLAALHRLRDLGNTLVLVEHDRDVIAGSDYLLDFGPRAGKLGGEVVAQGTPQELGKKRGSVTGPYLSGKKSIPIRMPRRSVREPGNPPRDRATNVKSRAKGATRRGANSGSPTQAARGHAPALATQTVEWLTIRGAAHHNLKQIDVSIPLGRLVAVTGPSGSGKSSLVDDVLFAALASQLHRANVTPGSHQGIEGIEFINKVIRVDQQPLGNSPTSNPATYTGVFDLIRDLFALLPDAKVR